MTTLDLPAIRARVEAACHGTWRADQFNSDRDDANVIQYGGTDSLVPVSCVAKVFSEPANAEFIAHARQDVPQLCDEIERLRAENALLLEFKFRPIGDNHHNAALCPHCGEPLRKALAEVARLTASQRQTVVPMTD